MDVMAWSNPPWLVAAFFAGLFSIGHCLPMCGGIAVAVAQSTKQLTGPRRWLMVSSYSIGRVVTYSLLGASLGFFAQWLSGQAGQWFSLIVRCLSGVMLILMGLYVSRWWMGLTRLERVGAGLWRRISPYFSKLMLINQPGQAILAGMLWGFLPCGLIYSALTIAAARDDWAQSAMFMMMFGLGTLVSTIAPALFNIGHRPLPKWLRIFSALLLIAFGVWIFWHNSSGLWRETDPHQHHRAGAHSHH